MSKPYLTLLREAVRDRFKANPALAAIFGNKVYLNRSIALDEGEFPLMAVYIDSVEPIENDYHPQRDERKCVVSVEALVKGKDMEGALDAVCASVEASMTMEPLEALMAAAGGPNRRTLLEIKWVGSDLGYLPGASETLGAAVIGYEIDYINPLELSELPDFEGATLTLEVSGEAAD
jgi:hypothetical protein